MVIKEYKKGKELLKLERVKKDIEKLLDLNKYEYNFKYEVDYRIVLIIEPIRSNTNNFKIYNHFKDIQDYLITKNIAYHVYWRNNWKELTIRWE